MPETVGWNLPTWRDITDTLDMHVLKAVLVEKDQERQQSFARDLPHDSDDLQTISFSHEYRIYTKYVSVCYVLDVMRICNGYNLKIGGGHP